MTTINALVENKILIPPKFKPSSFTATKPINTGLKYVLCKLH